MTKQWGYVLITVVSILFSIGVAAATPETTVRLDVNYLGLQANGGGWAPTLSADGHYVTFHSWATDLLSTGDANGVFDVYLRDLQAGVNYRLSDAWNGVQANGQSLYPAISANGLSVAFNSVATNLIPGGTSSVGHISPHDWTAGHIELVSVSTSGVQGNGASDQAAISSDGRYVVFRSQATNLIPGGNPYMAIYLRDRVNQTTECVSISGTGALANQIAYSPNITPDGRYVTFVSWANDLVPGDTSNVTEVFVRDRAAGTTERVSLSSTGAQANANSSGTRPAITPDGRYVAFSSMASNLVPGGTNGNWNVFLRDRVAGTTELVSVPNAGGLANGPCGGDSYVLAISANGRFVEFSSAATNLTANGGNGLWQTFVRDRQLKTTEMVSVALDGGPANNTSGYYSLGMSSDGSLRVFDSHARNLIPNDTSTCIDTYERNAGHHRRRGSHRQLHGPSDLGECAPLRPVHRCLHGGPDLLVLELRRRGRLHRAEPLARLQRRGRLLGQPHGHQ